MHKDFPGANGANGGTTQAAEKPTNCLFEMFDETFIIEMGTHIEICFHVCMCIYIYMCVCVYYIYIYIYTIIYIQSSCVCPYPNFQSEIRINTSLSDSILILTIPRGLVEQPCGLPCWRSSQHCNLYRPLSPDFEKWCLSSQKIRRLLTKVMANISFPQTLIN